MRKSNNLYSYFGVYEEVLRKLKDRRIIADIYEDVANYEDAVRLIADFLDSHLGFLPPAQAEFPERVVLAWHYAHKDYNCPMIPSEYSRFVDALKVDVFKDLIKRIKRTAGLSNIYEKREKPLTR